VILKLVEVPGESTPVRTTLVFTGFTMKKELLTWKKINQYGKGQ
jgi:hypothetical protein